MKNKKCFCLDHHALVGHVSFGSSMEHFIRPVDHRRYELGIHLQSIGGFTFGLSMRYPGMSLGMALALGLCAVFGTLIPPIYDGVFVLLMQKPSGQMTLLSIMVCVIGIIICGKVGMMKDKELDSESQKATIKEFSLFKGVCQRHPLGEPEQVTDACIDMSPSFIAGMVEHFPDTSITFDKFRVVKLLNEAMNEVRKAEARKHAILKGYKYTLLKRDNKLECSSKTRA